MDVDHFLATWRRTGSWGMILLNPGELPANPDPDRFLDAVNAFEISGNILSAERAYRTAYDTWPENQVARFALGNNFLLQGRNLEAGSIFRELLAINPDHVAAANNLAEVLVRQGCYLQAHSVIGRAVETAERINSPLTTMILQTQQQIREKLDRIKPDEKKECSDGTSFDNCQNTIRGNSSEE
jgi:tetratricopeptide (TPR) repeat protein